MARKMTKDEREAFLAEPHVGVLGIAAEPGRAPLTTPIWYRYEPGGDVLVMTSPGSRKARLIEAAGRFALCVQRQDGVYQYVSVEGPVVESWPMTKAERQEMAARYLPPGTSEAYTDAMDPIHGNNIAIVMRPERWNTSDFSDVGEQLTSR
ncbi:pyridoxamine 5'-phosphate oxidase family protein [Amycolatopsis sp. OK19-0408]|uniref:Pyridoxamine 5'-phosphate oxidase family protein n=1 Tax=Amycolatopsis iheyensis TaxID=2945988 RepID=A0A9X2ND61_9PSEU|nr:pyridoxamine 5'-phosphate oxidase family protein [Amycolatopsis iheyensis]MCR6485518.1 pyridoxamine 5'-phosphate oxidase family protein [Amycolatopsis iheyensis]